MDATADGDTATAAKLSATLNDQTHGWEKSCKYRWGQRAEQAGGITKATKKARSRTAARAILQEIPKGERPCGRREFHRQVVGSLSHAVSCMVQDTLQLPEVYANHIKRAMEKFEREWQWKALSDTHVTEPHGLVLADHEAQFLDKITTNVAGFYLCRRKSCLYIWRSVDWLQHDGWKFFCPACYQKYVPWPYKKAIQVKANLVWITGESKRSPDNMSLLGQDGKLYTVTPTEWPETTIQSLTNALKEAHGRLETSLRDQPPHERMRHVVQMAATSTAPSYLKHYQLPRQTLEHTATWAIDRQRREGVWGAHLRDLNTELFDDPADQQDILRAFLAANMIMKTCCNTTVVSRGDRIQHLLSEPDPTAEVEEIEV